MKVTFNNLNVNYYKKMNSKMIKPISGQNGDRKVNSENFYAQQMPKISFGNVWKDRWKLNNKDSYAGVSYDEIASCESGLLSSLKPLQNNPDLNKRCKEPLELVIRDLEYMSRTDFVYKRREHDLFEYHTPNGLYSRFSKYEDKKLVSRFVANRIFEHVVGAKYHYTKDGNLSQIEYSDKEGCNSCLIFKNNKPKELNVSYQGKRFRIAFDDKMQPFFTNKKNYSKKGHDECINNNGILSVPLPADPETVLNEENATEIIYKLSKIYYDNVYVKWYNGADLQTCVSRASFLAEVLKRFEEGIFNAKNITSSLEFEYDEASGKDIPVTYTEFDIGELKSDTWSDDIHCTLVSQNGKIKRLDCITTGAKTRHDYISVDFENESAMRLSKDTLYYGGKGNSVLFAEDKYFDLKR